MPDGTVITDDYYAEFNNGTFTGDITGTNGAFRGTLTAEAVDAVKNLTIKGQSVAITESSYLDDTGYRWDDDGRYRDVHSVSVLTPPDDDEGGFYRVLFQFKTIDGKGDNANFRCQFCILLDSMIVWESIEAHQRMYQYAGQYFSFIQAGTMTYGLHTLTLQYRIFSAPTNAYPRFFDIRCVLDYIRK